MPYGRTDAVEAALDEDVAAMIVEPVQGEGGVRIPAPDYLRELSRLCRANGSLLIVDEVQTGFCRTGPLFATGAAGAEADFLTMAKGIAGGLPARRLRDDGGRRRRGSRPATTAAPTAATRSPARWRRRSSGT